MKERTHGSVGGWVGGHVGWWMCGWVGGCDANGCFKCVCVGGVWSGYD